MKKLYRVFGHGAKHKNGKFDDGMSVSYIADTNIDYIENWNNWEYKIHDGGRPVSLELLKNDSDEAVIQISRFKNTDWNRWIELFVLADEDKYKLMELVYEWFWKYWDRW